MKRILIVLMPVIILSCSQPNEYFNSDKSRFHILKLFTYIYSQDTDPSKSTLEFHSYDTWTEEPQVLIGDVTSLISQNSQVYMRFNCDAFTTLHIMKINDFRQFKSDGYPKNYHESDGMEISQSDVNKIDIKEKQLFSFTYKPTHTSDITIAFTDVDSNLLIIDNTAYTISVDNHQILLQLATDLLNKSYYPDFE